MFHFFCVARAAAAGSSAVSAADALSSSHMVPK